MIDPPALRVFCGPPQCAMRFAPHLPPCLHHLHGLALLPFLVSSTGVGAQGVAERGFRTMASATSGNCVACHGLPGQLGTRSNFGPALDTVGARYSAEVLRQWVVDARSIHPDTRMPPFGTTEGTHRPLRAQAMLSPEEIDDVVAALQTLR